MGIPKLIGIQLVSPRLKRLLYVISNTIYDALPFETRSSLKMSDSGNQRTHDVRIHIVFYFNCRSCQGFKKRELMFVFIVYSHFEDALSSKLLPLCQVYSPGGESTFNIIETRPLENETIGRVRYQIPKS